MTLLSRALAAWFGVLVVVSGSASLAQPYSSPSPSVPPSSSNASPFGPGQPGGASPSGEPSLVGAWTGDKVIGSALAHGTTAFAPDGRYVSAAQVSNGLSLRVWGHYRVRPLGQGRYAIDYQTEGWLPRVLCTQAAGQQPFCQDFNLPPRATAMVTFTSANSIQTFDPEQPNQGPTNEFRDQNPTLLQMTVPEREIVVVQAAPQPSYGLPPVVGGGGGYRPIDRPAGPRCDDLQQRRICSINGGNLVPSGGCLVCVAN